MFVCERPPLRRRREPGSHDQIRNGAAIVVLVISLLLGIGLLLGRTIGPGDTAGVDTGERLPVVAADGRSGWVARNALVAPATYSGHALFFAQQTGHEVIGWYYPRCELPSGLVHVNVVVRSCPATTATTVKS